MVTTSTPTQDTCNKSLNSGDEEEEVVEVVISPPNSDTRLQSKHAIAIDIERVVGECPDVCRFDSLHVWLKSLKRKPTIEEQQMYREILEKLQLLIFQKRKEVTDLIKKYEQDFYATHRSLPSKDEKYINLFEKLNYIKRLLRQWKIIN